MGRVGPHAALAAVALWGALACADRNPGSTRQRSPVDTSASGVVRVPSTVTSTPRSIEWKLGDVLTEIGGESAGEDYALYRVGPVRRYPDGTIILANMQQELRVYDAAGVFVRSIGRRGDGPGEFRQLWTFYFDDADSIVAFNTYPTSLTVFGSDGGLGGTLSLTPQPTAVANVGGKIVGLVRGRMTATPDPHIWMTPRYVVTFGTDGQLRDTVAPASPIYWWGSLASYRGAPFRNGGGVAFGAATVYVASHEEYAIHEYDVGGHLVRSMFLDLPRRPVTRGVRDAWTRARMSRRRPERALEGLERFSSKDAPFPDSLPAISRVAVGRDGLLWVRRYWAHGDTSKTWDAFSDHGVHLATLRIPASLRITEFGRDYVLAVAKDELDVESVRLYSWAPGRS